MTIAAGDAHAQCIYGGRFRAPVALFDNAGSIVTGWTSPASSVSTDFGTAAAGATPAEVATTSGMGYVDLTATDTTGSNVLVKVTATNTGAKPTVLSIPVVRMPILRSGTAQAGGASTITLDSGAAAVDGAYVGMYVQISNNTPSNALGQTRKIISYVGSTKVATVESAWGTNPSSSSTFDVLVPQTVQVQGWMGKELAAYSVAGVPKVDLSHIGGSAVSTSTAQLGVNVVNAAGSAITAASGRMEVNMSHIAGSAVSTSTAQLGVNVVNFGGSAGSFTSGRPTVNTTHLAGAAIDAATAQIGVNVVNYGGSAGTFSGGRPEVNLTRIGGAAISTTTAQLGVNVAGYATGMTPLQPTTAGRTLDVTATGEAGIDWSNIGAPTTTVNLSGTTTSVVGTTSALAANSVSASALAADAGTEIAAAVWAKAGIDPVAAPAPTAALGDKLDWVTARMLNKETVTATTHALRNTGDTGDIAGRTVGDDGTTFTGAKWA